jgi:hypothetical protein
MGVANLRVVTPPAAIPIRKMTIGIAQTLPPTFDGGL